MNKFDELDTEYYVERAYELRRAYVAASIKAAAKQVKAFFKGLVRIPALLRPAH